MPRVVIADSARQQLNALIHSHALPASTKRRIKTLLRPLATFPLLGQALPGRWAPLRFMLGPWPWMLIVYAYDAQGDLVIVVSIEDARSANSVTSSQ